LGAGWFGEVGLSIQLLAGLGVLGELDAVVEGQRENLVGSQHLNQNTSGLLSSRFWQDGHARIATDPLHGDQHAAGIAATAPQGIDFPMPHSASAHG
jgi:hypothetical protein